MNSPLVSGRWMCSSSTACPPARFNSPGRVRLAGTRGFETSSVGNPVQFRQAWAARDVVKYSHERLNELPEVGVSDGPCLLIETLGEVGLQFRFPHGAGGPRDGWNSRTLCRRGSSRLRRAGDWCTAGRIHGSGQAGLAGLLETGAEEFPDAVWFGQVMAAWNCRFEGARGGMYQMNESSFQRDVLRILDGKKRYATRTRHLEMKYKG